LLLPRRSLAEALDVGLHDLTQRFTFVPTEVENVVLLREVPDQSFGLALLSAGAVLSGSLASAEQATVFAD